MAPASLSPFGWCLVIVLIVLFMIVGFLSE